MAILQSCCCWRSVRKGSYASAVYTMAYFTISVILVAGFIHDERPYLEGNMSTPASNSFLEPNSISHTTMVFNLILLCCASCGVITSVLLMYGLYKDIRALLVPWIITVLITMMVDLAHSVYLFALETMNFNPTTAILYTLDFFLLTLNIYSLLCVISQYQEYKAGRGTADDGRVPQVKYAAARPTATSCLSTRRPATYHESKPSPTQSPTALHSTLFVDELSVRRTSRNSLPSSSVRKHVQFPDSQVVKLNLSSPEDTRSEDVPNTGSVVIILGDEWKKDRKKPNPAVDTAPLIESDRSSTNMLCFRDRTSE